MRALILSLILAGASLAFTESAHAQEFIKNDYVTQTYGPPYQRHEEQFVSADIVAYRPEPQTSVRTDHGFSVPLGPVRLVGEGSSFRPSENERIRNERLQVAVELTEEVDALIGFRRFKHRQESVFSERELTFGIDFRMPTEYFWRLF